MKLNVKPLANEFWPLEGVFFDDEAGSGNEHVRVTCRIYGDHQFSDFVTLSFLNNFGVAIQKICDPASVCTFALKGDIDSINKTFYGFGIIFRKDFDSDEQLVVEVEGNRNYSFLICLE